jgi:hypothetical protein
MKKLRTSRDVRRKPRKDGLVYEESPKRGRKRADSGTPRMGQKEWEQTMASLRQEALKMSANILAADPPTKPDSEMISLDTSVQIQPGHAPPVPHRAVLLKVPSGEIAMEVGADGTYLRFDCDCLDALPYCKAACCSLCETIVTDEEAAHIGEHLIARDHTGQALMRRRSDGYCCCNDPLTKLCTIYDRRSFTCSNFHCTRNPTTRGWVCRLNRIDH